MTAALSTHQLAKDYGDRPALEPLDLEVPEGQHVALVGHNGSGKTTLLRMAAGLLDPSAGEARIMGHVSGSLEARRSLSWLSDTPTFYDDLSLWEHLEYVGRLHGVAEWQGKAEELLERLQSIERAAGRERPYRNAPRTLDLDLLLAGDRVIEEEGLSVPHPRMHQRAFVMRPLLELLPDVDIPGRGRASALLAGCADQRIERMGAFGQADTASPPNRIEARQTGTRQS